MKYLKNYLIALLSFAVSITLFLIIISLVFAYTNINDTFIDSAIFLAMSLSAFISSFFLCKKIKKQGLIHGICVNAISVLIIFVISCILNGSFSITNTLGIYIAICSLTGVVGGILGVNV
ncbi:MAG: TIGR04086 family membrane protein [Clostridia bacterium]|nr:TIGR04086 family membrane protein [Clostridia bacterium]